MKALAVGIFALVAIFQPAGRDPHIRVAAAAQAAQAARTCQNIQLLIQAQSSQGAAGHIAVVYRLHNLFAQTCTLYGYPGVQLLDRRFLSLPTSLHRGGSLVGRIPKRLVRVAAYGNAYFTLSYSDVPVNNQPCPTAQYLMIFAPNDILPVVTYAFTGGGAITPCSGTINVSPVTAHPRF